MSLTLYYHPLASFCWKVLIALYENETPFEPHLVDLADPVARDAFAKIWPLAKFPVLRDSTRGLTIPEGTIILEYLAQHHPSARRDHEGLELLPSDPDLARETRLRDRFFDLYMQTPMQTIVGDRIRPAGKNDPHGVEQAHAQLTTSYAFLETELQGKRWAMGDAFSMADCAAAPALYYANRVAPLGDDLPKTKAYLDRLLTRPSFKRVLKEAEPYFVYFPETPRPAKA